MKREANVNKMTKSLVVVAMMVAMIGILSFTPIGMIPLPTASATTAHIPVIITALLEGPIAGMLVGLAMGVTSMIRSMTPSGPLDLLFLNPLVSVLPRIVIPLTTYLAYVLLNKVLGGLFSKGNIVSYILAAAVGSMTNTIGCLGMLYIIYAKEIVDKLALDNVDAVKTVIFAIIATSGVGEMIVAAIVAGAVTPIIKKTFYK